MAGYTQVSPSPIYHVEPSLMSSLAWRKFRRTKDALDPNSVSIKEHLEKYLAL